MLKLDPHQTIKKQHHFAKYLMENLREMLAGKETDIFHSGSTD